MCVRERERETDRQSCLSRTRFSLLVTKKKKKKKKKENEAHKHNSVNAGAALLLKKSLPTRRKKKIFLSTALFSSDFLFELLLNKTALFER